MQGYFDEKEIVHYLNLCHLIRNEVEAMQGQGPMADLHTAIMIAKSESIGIGKFLVDAGLMTKEEYSQAIIDGLQTTLEAARHQRTEVDKRKNWWKRVFGS